MMAMPKLGKPLLPIIICRNCQKETWTGFRVNRVKSGRRIVARSQTGRLCLGCARKTAQAINDELTADNEYFRSGTRYPGQ
jgi:hypothetical protein